jgi:hypothetical protein
MFNSFLNTYLRIFYSCYPLIRTRTNKYNNNWITTGIRTSCKRKKELFSLIRNSKITALKQYYKVYCNVLTKVIEEANRMTINKRISKSTNKTKTTWNIINELLGKQQSMWGIQKLNINRTQITNQQDIANELNRYFSSVNNPESNSDKLGNVEYGNYSSHSNPEQGKGYPCPSPGF